MTPIVRQCLGVLASFLVLGIGLSARAQDTDVENAVDEPGYTPTLVFDAAEIRPAPPPGSHVSLPLVRHGVPCRLPWTDKVVRESLCEVTYKSPRHSSRFEATNVSISALLHLAFGDDAPIVGVPDWATNLSDNITLTARSDAAADARLAKLTDNEVGLEKRHAIRVLLADRLGLKTHLETRDTTVYNLVVAKKRVKISPNIVLFRPATDRLSRGRASPVNVHTRRSLQGIQLGVSNATMRQIASALSSIIGPVVDKTGLPGTYNMVISFNGIWTPADFGTDCNTTGCFSGFPPIESVVQYFGLRFEKAQEPLPNLVVDQISKPTGNSGTT